LRKINREQSLWLIGKISVFGTGNGRLWLFDDTIVDAGGSVPEILVFASSWEFVAGKVLAVKDLLCGIDFFKLRFGLGLWGNGWGFEVGNNKVRS
jgi:hypothetical protein